MFGLPEHNVHGFETGTISDVVKDVHYGTAKKASENGKYIYIRMNNITYEGNLDLSDIKHIDVSEKELAGCMVQQGDVLFNRTNSKDLVGKTCYFSGNEPMIIAGYIIRLRMNGKVVPEYLSIFMNLDRSKKLLYNMAKGAVGQANINSKEVQSIEIVIPPEGIQRSFLLLLKQSDKSKFYGKSQFIEMFGDLDKNTKQFPVKKLNEISSYWNGLTYKPADTVEAGNGTLVLRSSNIQEGDLAFDDNVFVSCAIKEKLLVQDNDILMCSRNGSAALVGKTALIKDLTEPTTFGAFMMIIRSDYYSYLKTYFESAFFRNQISTGTSTINQITGKMLNEISLPVPDMDTVRTFEVFTHQSDKSKLSSIS